MTSSTGKSDRANARHHTHRAVSSERRTHLRLDDVLADLGVARSTFHDWRAKGRAPRCMKLPNGELRIRRCDYERWLETLIEDERT
jgi:predicted DNA-binding transcriptional regulator AlpA